MTAAQGPTIRNRLIGEIKVGIFNASDELSNGKLMHRILSLLK